MRTIEMSILQPRHFPRRSLRGRYFLFLPPRPLNPWNPDSCYSYRSSLFNDGALWWWLANICLGQSNWHDATSEAAGVFGGVSMARWANLQQGQYSGSGDAGCFGAWTLEVGWRRGRTTTLDWAYENAALVGWTMRWQNLDPRNRKFQKMNDQTWYITVFLFPFQVTSDPTYTLVQLYAPDLLRTANLYNSFRIAGVLRAHDWVLEPWQPLVCCTRGREEVFSCALGGT